MAIKYHYLELHVSYFLSIQLLPLINMPAILLVHLKPQYTNG